MKNFGSKRETFLIFSTCFISAIVMAIGVRVFLVPHQIAAGGFTGIATIIDALHFVPLSVGMIALVLNIPLFILSYKSLGTRFGLLSVFCTLVYTISLDLVSRIGFIANIANYLPDKALCSVYGASLFGIGLGIIIRSGGSTGGSDMLANIITTKLNISNIGIMIFGIDGAVIALSAIVFKSIEAPLYAFIVSFLSSKVIDYIIEGGKTSKAYYIFSEKSEEIGKAIVKELKRGATIIKGKGVYTQKEREMLLCLVFRTQSSALKRLVKTIDPNAFLFVTNVTEAYGQGFKPMK